MKNNEAIDSEGTTQEEARELLENLCEEGFSGSVENLALALGRDEEEIQDILDADAEVDEDLLMKMRGVSQERSLEID